MTLSNYFSLISQFFFKTAHTFNFRLGGVRVTATVTSGQDAVNQVPVAITLGQALQIVNLLSGAPIANSLTEKFVIDGLSISVTVNKA